MGLLKHLLFWPVTGPLFLAEFALDKVDDVVREQLTDDASVKAELLELQLRLELGEIDDADYVAGEAALMQRLREVREWRERFGMGVSGGLVRVAGSGQDEVVSGSPLQDQPAAPPPGSVDQGVSPTGPRVADPDSASVEIHLDWE